MVGNVAITFDAFKGSFFDRKKVTDPVVRMWKRQLSRFGAFVRQRSKTSIRYSKKSARPGEPPRAHRSATRSKTNRKTGAVKVQPVSLLREYIFFGYDPIKQSVVVGPALLRNTNSRTVSAKTIPELLEYGGSATIITAVRPRGSIRPAPRQARPARYAGNPFMRPAADKETPKFMESLKDSV